MIKKNVILLFGIGAILSMILFNNCGQIGNSGLSNTDGLGEVSVASSQEVKIAFLGDTGVDDDFKDVLELIVGEGVDAIMINGDFSYEENGEDDPSSEIMRTWRDQLLGIVDVNNIAVFGALGNHDIDKNDQDFLNGNVLRTFIEYFRRFRSNNSRMLAGCTGGASLQRDKDIILMNEACTFGNVTIVASGHAVTETQMLDRQFLEEQLDKKLSEAPSTNWKVAGYHFTLASMNNAGKGDGSKHSFFDIIRKNGAIGVQAHTHSAMASCPISSEFKKENGNRSRVSCAPNFDPSNRKISPGTGIFMDSSAGGYELRPYVSCENSGAGCGHLYDHISNEGYHRGGSRSVSKAVTSDFGAIFVVFNEGGDPTKAKVYYKGIDGQEVFNFYIRRDVAGSNGGGTPSTSNGNPQWRSFDGGRVLQRVSSDLACKPDILSGVGTNAGEYAILDRIYDRDRCAGNVTTTPAPSNPTPTGPNSNTQWRGVANGRVLQRVSSDLACKPATLSGVQTNAGEYAILERLYDRDRCDGNSSLPTSPPPAQSSSLGVIGEQYKKEATGMVLKKMSNSLSCRPNDLRGVKLEVAIFNSLLSNYREAECRQLGEK